MCLHCMSSKRSMQAAEAAAGRSIRVEDVGVVQVPLGHHWVHATAETL